MTVSTSATAPVVDGFDIASYGTITGQDKWWPGPADVFGNPGKTVGQTFTTGSVDVLLSAFTFQIREATQPTKTYTIRVGTVSESTFTEIASESATQSVANAADAYWTWTLDSPVSLSANTVYGVDVGLLSSTSAWETGIPYVYYTADEYAGGTRFRSGTAGYGVGDDTMSHMSGDRVFHIDMGSADPNAPDVDAGDNWITWSGQAVTLAPTVTNNDPLEPELSYLWTHNAPAGYTVAFDTSDAIEAPTVTITKDADTDNATVVALTLTVTRPGSIPIPDTMTIDVYDDACEAAKAVGTVLDETDFDANCITNLADFAEMALTWLDDYTLTAPVVK
ncbi:MAG: hypothetical protein KAV87_10735 [Desulfobacteraceae bacterium]|nr:hypothetical protein [Desulfobacteraceae bacterium]